MMPKSKTETVFVASSFVLLTLPLNGLDNVPTLSKEPKILLFGDQVKAKGLRTVEQLKIFCALEGKALPRNKTLRLPLIKLYRHLPLRQYRTLRFLRRMGPLRTMDATTVPAETIQIIEDEISQFSEAPQAVLTTPNGGGDPIVTVPLWWSEHLRCTLPTPVVQVLILSIHKTMGL